MLLLETTQLQSQLQELSASTAETVKKLTEGYELAVYEGQQPNAENDEKIWEKYDAAVEACRVWLRAVLAAEIFECQEEDIDTKVSLLLPDRVLELEIFTSDSMEYSELLVTPLGKMSYYTERAILAIPGNPVQLLFKYFSDLIHQMYNIVSMPNHCGDCDILHKHTVEDEDIVDVLGVHLYASVWYDLDKFFSYQSKEVSSC